MPEHPREDGLYTGPAAGNSAEYQSLLRFYRDDFTVINVTAFFQTKKIGSDVQQWFHRENTNCPLNRGVYEVSEDSIIRFTVESSEGKVKYVCVLEDDGSLSAETHSLINGRQDHESLLFMSFTAITEASSRRRSSFCAVS
eukprot:gnl/TRDRNA2_/TRDRNA2_87220_c0_seq1.p1 gnl/TRDRNA2_/TRDRNA2_87220_c0~~gnl/TRDRNA2_/TRDRNA2_87220_c0_seq1.p1  ORF type:complete len:141 (+),score=3.26 gnl/TRDRNA2_/TRDRNA2_87220_c0_seq1:154-576(+)